MRHQIKHVHLKAGTMEDSGMVWTMPITPSIVLPNDTKFQCRELQTSSFSAQTEGMIIATWN
jgi:hypothetical protein